jgi:hypothetical protein
MLADELVLRTIEAQEKDTDTSAEDRDRLLDETLATPMLDLLKTTAADGEDIDGDTAASVAAQVSNPISTMSSNISPVLARGQPSPRARLELLHVRSPKQLHHVQMTRLL